MINACFVVKILNEQLFIRGAHPLIIQSLMDSNINSIYSLKSMVLKWRFQWTTLFRGNMTWSISSCKNKKLQSNMRGSWQQRYHILAHQVMASVAHQVTTLTSKVTLQKWMPCGTLIQHRCWSDFSGKQRFGLDCTFVQSNPNLCFSEKSLLDFVRCCQQK